MGAVTDLYDLAAEYLGACETAVATTPGGPIGRAFVSPGPPAWDCCPQLTVFVGGPVIGDTAPLQPPLQPGHRAEVGTTVHLVSLVATVIRCVPVIEGEGQNVRLPSPASMSNASKETCADVWAIWHTVRREYRAGTLFASPSGKRELFFDPAVALNPLGGCGGWQIQIRVQLDGYA